MNIVTYSLSANGPPQTSDYHEQLSYSVRSLRVHNQNVAIHVFLYGDHPAGFIAQLEDQAVSVHQMGAYVDAIKRIRPRAFRTLTRYPVLHKWLNLSELEPLVPSQILQADCDTFFFDDVDRLFEFYSERPFPSSNPLILDQVAIWLTLGQIPGLTHGFLSREHVIQGGEQAGHRQTEVVHHYFGMDKTAFLSEINRNFG